MSETQSWAIDHHSTSLPPRTKAVTSPDREKDNRRFRLVPADIREVANVGLKLIPVALVGKPYERVELLFPHALAHLAPTPFAFAMAEFWQTKASFAAIDHRTSVFYSRMAKLI
jgi:hypothetical protein